MDEDRVAVRVDTEERLIREHRLNSMPGQSALKRAGFDAALFVPESSPFHFMNWRPPAGSAEAETRIGVRTV